MATNSLQHRMAVLAAIGLGTIVFLMSTTPTGLPAIMLIVPFAGIFGFIYLAALEVVRFLGPDEDENGALVRLRRPRLLAAVVASFPVLLLVLQSVVELTVWDVLIAFAIVLLLYLYASRSGVRFWK